MVIIVLSYLLMILTKNSPSVTPKYDQTLTQWNNIFLWRNRKTIWVNCVVLEKSYKMLCMVLPCCPSRILGNQAQRFFTKRCAHGWAIGCNPIFENWTTATSVLNRLKPHHIWARYDSTKKYLDALAWLQQHALWLSEFMWLEKIDHGKSKRSEQP